MGKDPGDDWEESARQRIAALDQAQPGWRAWAHLALPTVQELACALEEIDALRAELDAMRAVLDEEREAHEEQRVGLRRKLADCRDNLRALRTGTGTANGNLT